MFIFVECMSGQYGDECLNKCSDFCKISNKCDFVSGECKGGCKEGWTGSDCYKAHFSGKFTFNLNSEFVFNIQDFFENIWKYYLLYLS